LKGHSVNIDSLKGLNIIFSKIKLSHSKLHQ
jgi:hypothetical protein